MSLIHDNVIVSYEVDLQNDRITLHTLNEASLQQTDIVYTDVLCHSFEHQMKRSIILAITEYQISNFIAGNLGMLQKGKDYGWPVFFETIDELEKTLVEGKYRYFNLLSSYGMNGWVLARNIEIVPR
ncbi:hypothetical protein M3194_27805 [Paenibacillus glycanilyticus]|uniref:hypothetical protein n=1 Tax=Paenibacillus glycanilyticus TaxID=126569 RepID=UPI00203FA15E|nr:hypothetical protein [Paenibacillus glycanilyticus]MCM3631123.1 hypothetical protein [Paenibacillus glycanilyticus]